MKTTQKLTRNKCQQFVLVWAVAMILTNVVAAAEDQAVPINRLRAPVKAKQAWVAESKPDEAIASKPAAQAQPKTESAAQTLVSRARPNVAPAQRRQQPVQQVQTSRVPTHNTARTSRSAPSPQRSRGASNSPNWLGTSNKIQRVGYTHEEMGGYVEAGPSCGCDSCSGGLTNYEPTCGLEPVYGVEPGCGFDTGCTGDACGIGCGCNACMNQGCPPCNPFGWWDWKRTEFFFGVQGFKGPPNFASGNTNGQRDGSASFGFHQGFNIGRPSYFLGHGQIGWQFGLRATQSSLNGAEFTDDERTQLFLTGGLFRRVDCGWQWGVVLDYLRDDWYYEVDLLQIRGELAWKVSPNNEFGFRMSQNTQTSGSGAQLLNDIGITTTTQANFVATDQYRFFHRRSLNNGILAEANLGFSGNSDVLLGANFDIPLSRTLGLRTGFDYLISENGSGAGGNQQEGWNLGLALVWTPCGRICGGRDYFRPLFNVADNGSFMIDRK